MNIDINMLSKEELLAVANKFYDGNFPKTAPRKKLVKFLEDRLRIVDFPRITAGAEPPRYSVRVQRILDMKAKGEL